MRDGVFSRGKVGSRRSRGTIGAHLVVLVALQLVFVLGLIGYAGIQDFRSARSEATGTTKTSADLAADFVAGEIEDEGSTLDLIPGFAGLISSPGVCQLANQDFDDGENDADFESFFLLLHLDGTQICPGAEGVSPDVYGDAAWFKQIAASKESVTAGPLVDPISGKHVMVFGLALREQNAVIAMVVDLASMAPTLEKKFGSAPVPLTFLVTTPDRSAALSAPGRSSDLEGTSFSRAIADSNTFDDLEGTEHIFAEAEVPGLGWHLFAGISTSDALASARKTLRERVVLAALIVLLVFAAATVLHRRFVRPIRSLASVTRKFAEGNLKAKVRPSGPIELAELGESLNAMLDARADAEKAVHRAYKAEKRAGAQLREVDAMRNAFLMAISHELRTPLTSVVGYASLIETCGDTLTAEERDMSMHAISVNSKRLERLLLDLLDVERLSRGTIEPNLAPTNVRELVMRVVEQTSANGRIKVSITGAPNANVDPALVERILENLISNAIKHTPPKTKIWVRATRYRGELILVVEDDGPGVPDEIKQVIFEPFKQGKIKEHAPGTGVGLSLVAQFARLHGGRAWVENRKGGGASFHVSLPVKATKVSNAATPAHGSENGSGPVKLDGSSNGSAPGAKRRVKAPNTVA
ncbi:MAG: ATP-binding protein [Actinomycetota bacterium]